jgi:hypothetical protein
MIPFTQKTHECKINRNSTIGHGSTIPANTLSPDQNHEAQKQFVGISKLSGFCGVDSEASDIIFPNFPDENKSRNPISSATILIEAWCLMNCYI